MDTRTDDRRRVSSSWLLRVPIWTFDNPGNGGNSIELGRTPKLTDILTRDDWLGLAEFEQAFETWYCVLWEAGLTPTESPSYWTKADIEHALRGLGDELERVPKTEDLNSDTIHPSLSVVHDRFESWDAALEAAGYGPAIDRQYTWTRKQLLDDLAALGDELGRKPTANDVADIDDMFAPGTYARAFGSWNAALGAAGFTETPVGSPQTYSDNELVETLRSVASELDRRPTIADVDGRMDLPSSSVYLYRVGMWTAALDQVDLDTTTFEMGAQYSREELLEALRLLADRLGRVPRTTELQVFDDVPASATYYRRFGSYTTALETAGILE